MDHSYSRQILMPGSCSQRPAADKGIQCDIASNLFEMVAKLKQQNYLTHQLQQTVKDLENKTEVLTNELLMANNKIAKLEASLTITSSKEMC